MAQAREKGGRVVFIGNIPYGVSEEVICEIFGRAGSVVNFRLVYDKETGKPKGFGFLEYRDVDQAAAAVRNLNGHEIMGRSLKVDYSNDNSGGKSTQNHDNQQRAPPPAHFDPNSHSMPNGAADLPPLPQGVDLPPGLTAPEAISKTLSAIPPAQLVDIISQMKTLVATDPQKATAILQQAPQLSFAVIQALILMGLVDQNIIGSLLQQQPQQPQAQQQPPPPMPYAQAPPPHFQQQQPSYGQPAQSNPYGAPPQQAYSQMQHPGYVPTPPQQQSYQPPPQPSYQPPAPQQQPAQPDQQALIQQVLAMTREQIYAMDEQPRNQLIALRAQLGAPVS